MSLSNAAKKSAAEDEVNRVAALLVGRGHRGETLAESLQALGAHIISAASWPQLLAVLEWEAAVATGHVGEIKAARARVEAVERPDADQLSRPEEYHRLYDAGRWLEKDSVVAAEEALALLDSNGSHNPRIRLAASTVLALACVQLNLREAAQRYASVAAEVGLDLLEGQTDPTERAMVAYRSATAIDLLLRETDRAPQEVVRRAVSLIEQARSGGLPARPVDRAVRQLLDYSAALPQPPVAPTEPIELSNSGVPSSELSLDLADLAAEVTGRPGIAWWWGIRVTEGAAWVASVAPSGEATLSRQPVNDLLYVLEQLADQLPFAAESEHTEQQVLRRFRQRGLGLDGRAGAGLAGLVPGPLQQAAARREGPAIPVAVSVPASVHYLPPAALPLGRTRRLLEKVCPVYVAGKRSVEPSPRPPVDVRQQVVISGNDGGLAGQVVVRAPQATLRLASGSPGASGEEVVAGALTSQDIDVAVLTGHISTGHSNALHAPDGIEDVDRYRLDLGGRAWLSANDIDALPSVPWCVVLAGCRSGGAMAGMSDERAGLATRFLNRGARWVVATLWPIRSDHFQVPAGLLNNLHAGLEPPEALRLAQLDAIDEYNKARAEGSTAASTFAWLPWVCLASAP